MKISILRASVFLLTTTIWYSAVSAQEVPASVNRLVAGIPVNYDEDKVGSYTLPDPLVMLNGKKVKNSKTWYNKRRPEIVGLFEEFQYGRMPGVPKDMSFNVFDKDSEWSLPAAEVKVVLLSQDVIMVRILTT